MIVLIIILVVLWSIILNNAIKKQQENNDQNGLHSIKDEHARRIADRRCPPHKWVYVEVGTGENDPDSLKPQNDNKITYIRCTACGIIPR